MCGWDKPRRPDLLWRVQTCTSTGYRLVVTVAGVVWAVFAGNVDEEGDRILATALRYALRLAGPQIRDCTHQHFPRTQQDRGCRWKLPEDSLDKQVTAPGKGAFKAPDAGPPRPEPRVWALTARS